MAVLAVNPQNNFTYVGKLHSFDLTQRKSDKIKGGVFISGRVNIATDENTVLTTEVFSTPITAQDKPNQTYQLLCEIITNYATVAPRIDEDAELTKKMLDPVLIKQIGESFALVGRQSGWDNAPVLRVAGSYEPNTYLNRVGEEVTTLRRKATFMSASNSTDLSATFRLHAVLTSAFETGVSGVFKLTANGLNYKQDSIVPIELKVDLEGAGDILAGMVGEMLLLEGDERSTVIEQATSGGLFGTRTRTQYDKGLFVTFADGDIDFDADEYEAAKKNYELIRAQNVADARERKNNQASSTPAAPGAATGKTPLLF